MKVTRPEDIGALIRGYRIERGLSQSQLAARLQSSQRWISLVENGKATAHIGLILKALNELGFTLSVVRDAEPRSGTRRAKRFSIDDIVDG